MGDELWMRRWIAKTSFVFGMAAGFLLGFVIAWRMQ
jgi:hypothetical protein